jgi:hypothetical protein
MYFLTKRQYFACLIPKRRIATGKANKIKLIKIKKENKIVKTTFFLTYFRIPVKRNEE